MECVLPDLRIARRRFAEGASLPTGLLPTVILRSWERSRAAGLTPWGGRLTEQHPNILELTDADAQLAACVQPELERLWGLIGDSKWILFCVNLDNRIVQTRQPANACSVLNALQRGRRVAEYDVGTTAPACTLAEAKPCVVTGNQHYLEEFSDFFCVSVPVHGVDGKLLGALDLTGIGMRQAGTMLERLKHAALATENNFFAALPDCQIIELQHDLRLLGSPLQALLAVDEAGTILAANRAAQHLMDIDGYNPSGLMLEHLMENSRQRPLSDKPSLLTLSDGTRLYGRLCHLSPPRRVVARITQSALGSDLRINTQFEHARKAFVARLPVLISGATGTGKEVFARALHKQCCPQTPFVAINCASIPENLIEAELFGYVDGSFTGARRGGSIGLMEAASDGTLLLDEIGDMPLSLQSRLLRALQEREITRIGGTEPVPLKAHIIAATHRPLRCMVETGTFREDLYYRLDGLRVQLPALDERLDKHQLIDSCFAKAGSLGLNEHARAALHSYNWPGNLRQLENVAKLAHLLAAGEAIIDVSHLPDEVTEEYAAKPPRRLSETLRNTIERVLLANDGNVAAAARELGISRTTLYKRLAKEGG